MKIRLKPLSEQTIVITGASSGIGLCTAKMAARAGARVVLTARSDEALDQIARDIRTDGGIAVPVHADVAREEELQAVARKAQDEFGGFDTWVNNAGVSIYGRIEDVALEDFKRLFDTNFWGVVNGSRIALDRLRSRTVGSNGAVGGSIINLGSCLSDRAIPLQGMYCASKHAVKGFTDALRMEVEEQALPVSITLIKPGAIDTPYIRHAKNYLPEEPINPPPVYAPETVARAILHAATHPVRDIIVGAGGKALSLMDHFPRVADKVMEHTMFRQQHSGNPPRPREDHALDKPSNDPAVSGGYPGFVQNRSVYTTAALHPMLTTTLLVAAGATLAAVLANSADQKSRTFRGRTRTLTGAARRFSSDAREAFRW
jgi:NAD(P)-dependent dehydrogenase (short-subunit alcohol dehydrogenase family)